MITGQSLVPTLGDASTLVVVGTPLQALNAAEFVAGRRDVALVALEPGSSRAGRQLHTALAMVFPSVTPTTLPFGSMSGRAKRRWLRSFRPNPSVETVVLGAVHLAFTRQLARAHPGADVVAVDDGSMTPAVVRYRNGDADSPYLSGDRIPGWRRLAHRVAGVDGSELPTVRFFSVYDLDVRPPDEAIVNCYPYLRSTLGGRLAVREQRLIVGSSAVDTDLVDEATYRELVGAMVAAEPDRPARYRPHRHEDLDRARRICGDFGIELDVPDLPLELDLLAAGEMPAVLECSFSTVTDTVPLLLDPSPMIRIWLPAEGRLSVRARENVREMADRWSDAANPITWID